MSKICRKKSIISYTSDVGLQPWITSWKHLLQLFQKGLRLEVFWDVVVQSCDYLVDLLFPRRINVLAGSDRLKEFFEGLFNDPAEAVGYLQNMDLVNGCPRASKEPRTFDTFVTVKVCIRNLNSAASFALYFLTQSCTAPWLLFSNAKWRSIGHGVAVEWLIFLAVM